MPPTANPASVPAPAPTTKPSTTGTITSTATVARIATDIRTSLPSRGLARAQASAIVTSWPRTARLTTTVRMPCTTIWANSPTTAETICATLVAASISSPGSPKVVLPVTAESWKTKYRTVNCRIDTTVTTAADRPSCTFQCRRIVEIAPSRISPTPRGRSGTTPGLTSGGPCATQPAQPGCGAPGSGGPDQPGAGGG